MATKAAAAEKKAPATGASLSTAKLVQSIVDKAGKKKIELSKKQVTQTLDMLLETVAEEVRKGNKVSLKNFGVFRRHTKPARPKRKGRNPATGEEITIPAKKAENVIKFRPAKTWKEAVKAARK
ncbi:HU family DNA-binding protein [Vulgatibacter sp.]|uniref:HU family DNA-binding protein n=1 Tax=Vulgatibacter sp. TaxID=1971226 RepID=UPI0035672751